jgi:hypothetical protein
VADKKPKRKLKDGITEWIKKTIEGAVAPSIKGSVRDKRREQTVDEYSAYRVDRKKGRMA